MIDPLLLVLVGMLIVVGGIIWLRLHAFIALLIAAFVVALLTPESAIEQFALARGMSPLEASQFADRFIGERIAAAFGNTTAQIGILIAMAAVIGKCLLESGAAERIVRSILKVTGTEKSPLAFAAGSFFLGIPVFFDTVFFLMIPLARAMAVRIGKYYLFLVLVIAGGAAMAHSLVPPTPGPLFLIGELQIPIHMMMIGGLLVGSITVSAGFGYAAWADKRLPIPLRDSLDAPIAAMQSMTQRDIRELPALWFSVMPIVVPLVFIAAAGILATTISTVPTSGLAAGALDALFFVGEKNAALVIGGLISLGLLVQSKNKSKEALSTSMQEALTSGGVIILITAAGGAFGAMLQQTGVSSRIEELTAGYQMALIPLAFFITAVVRTAQGSATVSMITAAGILSGLALQGGLDFHPLYLGLAIACGSKLVPWMNDSGFWVVSKMSNLTEEETLQTFSVMLTIMGLVGFGVTFLGAWLFPLT